MATTKGEFESKRNYINGYPRAGNTSYLTEQALRRLRHLHTTIATHNWRPCRIKDASWTGNQFANIATPKQQQHAHYEPSMSLGPVQDVRLSPENRGFCVSPTRDSRVSPTRHDSRVSPTRGDSRLLSPTRESFVSSTRDSFVQLTREPRATYTRGSREDVAITTRFATAPATSCFNTYDIEVPLKNRHGSLGYTNTGLPTKAGHAWDHTGYVVVPRGAFLPRRRVLTQKLAPRKYKWTTRDQTINNSYNHDDLRLVSDSSAAYHTPLDKGSSLPSIATPDSPSNNQHHPLVRQTLEVKHVRLKTPPPSPYVKHISVHLPAGN